MKIALVSARFVPSNLGGAEEIVRINAKYLALAGHDVTVLTSYINVGSNTQKLLHREIHDGYTILRFRQFNFQQLGVFARLLLVFFGKTQEPVSGSSDSSPLLERPSKIAEFVFDIVFKWGSWIFSPGLFFHILGANYNVIHLTPFPHTHVFFAARAASLSGIPTVLTPAYHVEVQGSMAWQLKLLAEKVSKLAVFTEKERIDLAELGIPMSKMVVVPPGLIPPSDINSTSAGRFRESNGIGENPIVMFAGSKTFDKGIFHIVDAMVLVCKIIPNATLVAIGPGDESVNREIEKKLPNAINLGYLREEKWSAFSACDLFVMPSRCDSFGLVYTEAWLSGKPVIGANCGSTPYVIHDGIDGILVPFGDVEALASSILMLLGDPHLRDRLGDAGRQYTLDHYLASVVVDKLVEVYKDLS
jgi:glycosyltransferase involved in cell wall biosynthesis